MNHADPETIKNINAAALKEFTDKGFKNASLRNIVKEAGVTTGAFYGYYKSKEELFDKIVGGHAKHLTEVFTASKDNDYSDYGKSRISELTMYTYRNWQGMKLLVAGSDGTQYENFFHELTNKTVEGMKPYMKGVTDDFAHALVSGMFASYCELVIHDAQRCEAGTTMFLLWQFYEAGWKQLLTNPD